MRKWVHHIQYWTLQIATQISKMGVWGGLPTCQDLGGVKQPKLETNWSKQHREERNLGKSAAKPLTYDRQSSLLVLRNVFDIFFSLSLFFEFFWASCCWSKGPKSKSEVNRLDVHEIVGLNPKR